MTCTLHYAYFYVRSVGSSALWPLLFSVARPTIQNANWKVCTSLFIQPDGYQLRTIYIVTFVVTTTPITNNKAIQKLYRNCFLINTILGVAQCQGNQNG